jgi:hypothetical protein
MHGSDWVNSKHKLLGSGDCYSLSIVIVFQFDELLFVQFILLYIFVPEAVAVYTLHKWSLLQKLSSHM